MTSLNLENNNTGSKPPGNNNLETNEKPTDDQLRSVFSFPATFYGCVEANLNSDGYRAYMNSVANYILSDKYKPVPSFDPILVDIIRASPSNNYFIVEKQKKTGGDKWKVLFNFEDIIYSFSFDLAISIPVTFTCFVLRTKTQGVNQIAVFSFKDYETRFETVHTLECCRKDLMAGSTEPESEMGVIEESFFFSMIRLKVNLQIYEPDNDGELVAVPNTNHMFKLRKNVPKFVELIVKPDQTYDFVVERCFGVLHSTPDAKFDEMKLFDDFIFERPAPGNQEQLSSYRLRAKILPGTEAYVYFSTQTKESMKSSFNVGADFVIKGVKSPLRLSFPFKGKMYSEKEKFWINIKQEIAYEVLILLGRSSESTSTDMTVVNVDTNSFKNQSGWKPKFDSIFSGRTQKDQDDDTKDDSLGGQKSKKPEEEAVYSGTFSFDVNLTQKLLSDWSVAVQSWESTRVVPSNLQKLLKTGVPNQYRKIVWPYLLGVYDITHKYCKIYDELLTKTSDFENVIARDVSRTFPCHDYFRISDGEGQRKLFRICKAYSIFDDEVGYCQGISFIVADLLLHVEEKIAFGMLVEIMKTLMHREMFLDSFYHLQAQMYVLKRLITIHLPNLGKHFSNIGIEPHVFAPQWFLTLFTAKFPLGLVDQALDMILSMGRRSLLQISLGLLHSCSSSLMTLDFEETLKYFRIDMPRKFTNSNNAKNMFLLAHTFSISSTLVDELVFDFDRYKRDMALTQDPMDIIKADNKMHFERILRLEQENDMLAQNLVTHQVYHSKEIQEYREKNAELIRKLDSNRGEIKSLKDFIEDLEGKRVSQTEEMQRMAKGSEDLIAKKNEIIKNYKDICGNLESEKYSLISQLSHIHSALDSVRECDRCHDVLLDLMTHNETAEILDGAHKSECDLVNRINLLEMELATAKTKLAVAVSLNDTYEYKIHTLTRESEKKRSR